MGASSVLDKMLDMVRPRHISVWRHTQLRTMPTVFSPAQMDKRDERHREKKREREQWRVEVLSVSRCIKVLWHVQWLFSIQCLYVMCIPITVFSDRQRGEGGGGALPCNHINSLATQLWLHSRPASSKKAGSTAILKIWAKVACTTPCKWCNANRSSTLLKQWLKEGFSRLSLQWY